MSELYLPGIDFPTVTKPDESADVRRTRKRRTLLDAGVHPLTMLPLAGNGETCGTCAHHYPVRHRSKGYHKCDLTPQTHGPGTDLRISWPACERWEAVPS